MEILTGKNDRSDVMGGKQRRITIQVFERTSTENAELRSPTRALAASGKPILQSNVRKHVSITFLDLSLLYLLLERCKDSAGAVVLDELSKLCRNGDIPISWRNRNDLEESRSLAFDEAR